MIRVVARWLGALPLKGDMPACSQRTVIDVTLGRRVVRAYVRESLAQPPGETFYRNSGARLRCHLDGPGGARCEVLELAALPKDWHAIADVVAGADVLRRPVRRGRSWTVDVGEAEHDARLRHVIEAWTRPTPDRASLLERIRSAMMRDIEARCPGAILEDAVRRGLFTITRVPADSGQKATL